MKISNNIFVDEFRERVDSSNRQIYILTHWHSDHLIGLKSTFSGTIYCSSITSKLLKLKYPKIHTVRVKLNKYLCNVGESIFVLDSNHLPGSIMLYFPDKYILYTGDYKLSTKMLRNLKHKIGKVDTLYIDGTFHDSGLKFLSEQESINLFHKFIKDVDGPIAIGVFHVGTCALLKKMGLRFSLDKSISQDLRVCLSVMFKNYLLPKGKARFVLVQPNKFLNKEQYNMIIPSSLWFACHDNIKYIHKIVQDNRGNWRINFTCHSDYYDNVYLAQELDVDKIELLNDSKVNLKCR
jgi:Cft2 family RNA processing exonuclease